YTGGTPAYLPYPKALCGQVGIISQSPSRIVIFKAVDSNSTVSGNGNFTFTDFEMQSWTYGSQSGSSL
ncbi:MAG: hypothetical protein ACP5EP_12230, partial [Acidobacteriaceae bacterium]